MKLVHIDEVRDLLIRANTAKRSLNEVNVTVTIDTSNVMYLKWEPKASEWGATYRGADLTIYTDEYSNLRGKIEAGRHTMDDRTHPTPSDAEGYMTTFVDDIYQWFDHNETLTKEDT